MRKLIQVFTISVMMLTGAGASAADFTFNVPVDAKNLTDDVVSVMVQCNVYKSSSGNAIGIGIKEQAVSSNRYNGTVTVQVDADEGEDPASASRWSCTLYLDNDSRARWGGRRATQHGGQGCSTHPYKCAKESTPFNNQVSGTF